MAEGLILAGTVYMAPIDSTGTRGKLVQVGNAQKLAIKPNSSKKEQKSKMRGSYGTAITTVMLPDPSDFTLTMERIDKNNLLYQFLGTEAAFAQTSGAVVDEVAIAAHGGWVKLAAEKVSAVVVKNQAGAVTYVLGTDYTVNTDLGMVQTLSTGAIADAASLKISYTKAAITDGWAINGSTKASIRAYILLDGENIATGELMTGEFYDVMLTPDQEIDFLADDLVQIGLSGSMTKPDSRPAAYQVRGRAV